MNRPGPPQNNFLETILRKKRQEVDALQRALPLAELRARVESADPPRDFRSIFAGPFACIAEIKRASPSRGVLTKDFDPERIARAYEKGGAAAVSVLTDQEFFGASSDDLRRVKHVTSIPVLRKEFIIADYQIYESRVLGADAMLLIAEVLKESQLRKFILLAKTLGMASLVEGHTPVGIKKAVQVGAEIVGINNRDLNTFSLDPETSFRLRPMIPNSIIAISESGIKTSEELQKLKEAGFRGALIGESLIELKDREQGLRRLLGPLRNQ